MNHELILAGFGGQGIMFAGQLLAYAGMLEDKHVSWIPSYGPEMRGGTANCSVVVSDKEISCPIVTEPSILVALNMPSLEKFEPSVQEKGLIVYNSSLAVQPPSRNGIDTLAVPGNKIAEELGNSRVVNMVMVGALVEKTGLVSMDSVFAALEKVLPEHRRHLIPLNKSALEAGAERCK
jgi:2-oxoglutarate ferredoxin oxidoreductase subunit gamma